MIILWKKLTQCILMFRLVSNAFLLTQVFQMSSNSTTTSSAQPRGGSPVPPTTRPVIRREDAERLLLNIIEARTTSYASDLESSLDHAYFIVNAMLEANRSEGSEGSEGSPNTDIFSEMIRLINDARDVMFDTDYTDADGFPLDYVNPRAVPFIIRLNDKYVELINQTTQIE